MTSMETERLIIRNFDSDDWQALQEMIIQYESSEYAVYDHKWPTSAEEIKGVAEWFAGGDRFLAVCLKETGRFIGFISLNKKGKEDCQEFSLGYVFNFNYHGKGYATEGCRAIIDHAFSRLGADRIMSSTAAANYPSCRLLNRLGMRKTGEGTASFWKTEDGKPIEFPSFSFTLSRDEWLENQQK
jgi:ribosomal-protein-alanine N-acetyltransferase